MKPIYIGLFLIFPFTCFSQEYKLLLKATNPSEQKVLNNLDFQKKFENDTHIKQEIHRIADFLKKNGYFLNTLDSVKIIDQNYIAYFSLDQFIEKAILRVDSLGKKKFKSNYFKKNTLSVPIKELPSLLHKITSSLDNQGRSFSKVQLQNIVIKEHLLFADLDIKTSKKRNINKVIIKGYGNFPKTFLKNYFNLKEGTLMNQKKIKTISSKSNNLRFITTMKPPEVLFTNDSTKLFLYFKKKQNNSFEGMVNFASKENGNIQFNGIMDVKFLNIINKGERFEIFWNRIGNERQEFKVTTEIPYLFQSKISPEIAFSIYKQDSTFLNTNFKINLKYRFHDFYNLGVQYESNLSESLHQTKSISAIEKFSTHFYGGYFSIEKPKNDSFFFHKFFFEIAPSFGNRKTLDSHSKQFKIKSLISYIWDISPRNSVYIKNETGFLNSDTYLENELFRIGGVHSIRGFNEQSIFTKSYGFFSIEYRFLTSNTSYLYTITDLLQFSSIENQIKAMGLGLGFLFNFGNSQINLNMAVGKNEGYPFNLKDIKLAINWKNYF